jgi:GNAT superfamily N-acetyltransferase
MLQESPTAFSSDYQDESNLALEHYVERARFAADNFVVGAFDDQQLIGCAGGYREKGAKRRHIANVWGMYVHPAYRGQGLGRELLNAVVAGLRDLDGLERILIGVTAGNTAAETLYASYGFVAYGTEPGAIKVDGIDHGEVLMQLTLSR